ncbi:MAG: hypothetical protein EAZ81_10845 [Verrucomicrobia bacterium]|nr:MAG: hypothetical protein EAZ81_10845 [Verrucomicrobiota bacterium]
MSDHPEELPSIAAEIPHGVFPVPSGSITHEEAARIIFPVIAEKKRVFLRDFSIYEVIETTSEGAKLRMMEAERLVATLTQYGHTVRRREEKPDGNLIWRKTNFPKEHAKTILQTDAARYYLPVISRVISAPVISQDEDGRPVILQKGYHHHGGGTLITKGKPIPDMPLGEAVQLLKSLLADFNFCTPADGSRAMASFISPALKFGDLLNCDFPIDFAEADQSQSGKTYRQKIVCAIYGEIPSVITEARGGVGSLDESISAALIDGKPFITIDNLRSRLDSTILETAVRGHGTVTARALRTSTTIETRHYLWQISTNGAELTRDAANRCIVTKITKRPSDARYRVFPEGDLLQHVKANQHLYLGAVFAVVRDWIHQGKPKSGESRHDFRDWVQSLDWIVTEIIGMPPIMDGHQEEQMRTANPQLQWLRLAAIEAVKVRPNEELSAMHLAEICDDADIPLPIRRGSKEEPFMTIGKIMRKIFTDAQAEQVVIESIKVTRIEKEALAENGNWKPLKFYHFTR